MGANRARRRTDERQSGVAIIWRRLHRRHLVWGGVAAVLSLLLHLAVWVLFPGFTICGLVRERGGEKARRPPLRVQDVKMQPAPTEAERRPPRFRPEAGRGAGPGGISAEASAFRRVTDDALVEPRPLDAGVLIGEQRSLAEPAPVDRPLWEPREEILAVERKVAPDRVYAKPRRLAPAIPRLSGAQDIVTPADRMDLVNGVAATGTYLLADDPAAFAWGRPAGGGSGGGEAPETPPPAAIRREEPRKLVDEGRDRVAVLKALEKYLKADVFVYRALTDSRYAYCRIEIKRRGGDALPVLPKDLLLVQDASASITEQKLHFCRQGLQAAIGDLRAGDRFNVVAFRDTVSRCFPEWAEATPANLAQAGQFVADLRAAGDTDIFASLKELLALPRKPGRPVIMEVVSDGVATVGLTDRARIIEAFSQENQGALSVFTVGTYPGVNAYLLDLLSYRNRGDTFVVRTGRWDIPRAIAQRAREVSQPVLSEVRFRFGGKTYCEAYPALTSNLYLDRPLVIFGRCPREADRLVFQATGQADEIQCDMVFDIDLAGAESGDRDIRTQWAWQKAYYLIGEHNRTRNAGLLDELRQLGRAHGIRIPYQNELSD
jgi:hypothetical protein